MMVTDSKVLECIGVSKSFGPTKAVVNVNFSVNRGEIRGLIGENGSGKSTLCGLITGLLKPDEGQMTLLGKEYKPDSLIVSKNSGIAMLQQECGTIEDLTVAQNIFLGREASFTKRSLVNRKKMDEYAKKALLKIGLDISPKAPVTNFSLETRKLIEVSAAVYLNPQILIVDETTTALSQSGREMIYKIVRWMREENRTVIFITHDMQELMDICDTITILRDGQLITTVDKNTVDENEIRQMMIGRDLTGHYYRDDEGAAFSDKVVLDINEITYGNSLKKVSMQLHKGEILGIGGLTECGMHELGKVIFGAIKPDIGAITVTQGSKIIRNTTDALNSGIAYVAKDRDHEAIFLGASIKENITIASFDKTSRHGLLSKRREKQLAAREAERLTIKMQGIKQLVKHLSGGNKQKVSIAKWLANDSEILVMDCPTRGIDIGVKAAIYTLIEQLSGEGRSIILISEELPELIGMADRLIIFKNGVINGEFMRGEGLDERKIIQKMI